jgi:hypothetical protein
MARGGSGAASAGREHIVASAHRVAPPAARHVCGVLAARASRFVFHNELCCDGRHIIHDGLDHLVDNAAGSPCVDESAIRSSTSRHVRGPVRLGPAPRALAVVNIIPIEKNELLHGSIAGRMRFLRDLSEDPARTEQFDRACPTVRLAAVGWSRWNVDVFPFRLTNGSRRRVPIVRYRLGRSPPASLAADILPEGDP